MIQRLENMGLVAKAADPRDGRLNVLNLTRKARELAPEILSAAAALEKNIEQAVGKEDMAGMIRGLKVIRNIKF
jgi:DNA-binding MarR family transcriptional regulator